ncbi:MAG: hypothetical protein EXS09_15660 [Gemmataceae bacterium]|nr:hypothetical protein [Gemmataceae bacterium]
MRLAVVLILLAPLGAFAKLEIRNVQPAHGVLGPPRTSDDVVPLDEYLVRYQVAGIKPDKDGKADLEITATLSGPDGKAVVPGRKTPPAPRPLSLGGDVVQTFGSFTFPEKAPLGAYKLTVAVRDRTSDETTSFERKITCKAPNFQIIVPRFFHDSEGKVPAGTTGLVGETLHYSFRVLGYDKSQKKVALIMTVTILDNDGKDMGAKPLEVKGDINDPTKATESRQANFTGSVQLHRSGEFKLKIVVEDTIAKQTTAFEVPLKVFMP